MYVFMTSVLLWQINLWQVNSWQKFLSQKYDNATIEFHYKNFGCLFFIILNVFVTQPLRLMLPMLTWWIRNKLRRLLRISTTDTGKEEYARTRASDSKHLPAVILNVFFVNILGLYLISFYQFKKTSFAMVLYEKNFEMIPGHFLAIYYHVLLSSNCCDTKVKC